MSIACIASIHAEDKVTVTPKALVEASLGLADSSSKTVLPVSLGKIRYGLAVSKGHGYAEVSADLIPYNSKKGSLYLSKATVGVKSTDSTVGVALGRFKPLSPVTYGAEPSKYSDGYNSEFGSAEGLVVSYDTKVNDLGLGLEVYVANALGGSDPLSGYDPTFTPSVDSLLDTPLSISARVYGLGVALETMGVVAQVAFATHGGYYSPVAPGVTSDATRFIGSLGYTGLAGLNGGVYYKSSTLSNSVPYTVDKNTIKKLDANTATKSLDATASVIGVGVRADSTLANVKGVINAEDKFSLGLSYALGSTTHKVTNALDKDYNQTEIALDVTYTYSPGTEVILGYGMWSLAKAKAYKQNDGVTATNSRSSVYLGTRFVL